MAFKFPTTSFASPISASSGAPSAALAVVSAAVVTAGVVSAAVVSVGAELSLPLLPHPALKKTLRINIINIR